MSSQRQFSYRKKYCYRSQREEQHDVVIKRCFQCDQALGDGPAYSVDGCTYHAKHFACCACRQPIEPTQTFQVLDQDKICCSPCFGGHYAPKCSSCGKGIVDMCVKISRKELYHQDCFVCSRCHHPLTTNDVLPDGEGGYMDNECYWASRLHKFVLTNKQKALMDYAGS
ncbi:unnamed protein product [Bursaphelenchus okinawaensis]|uniref:LIM zinc-binding domain-containing protein n=1 Tax=Bursaphelenchus okinawaensis TaxID=465554 RepID=A0A811KY36_9BILA|nr:unnamed protein product [Bursaphelenchus okinawaensis]CAG9114105.1 unnamed protein product [Bursaphelenchus okinawaensis]